VNTFTYNGLGLRVAKTDSTGQFALVSDGTSPASPVIADGAAVYTPGLSERRNGASFFRHDDLLGSLRFLTDSSEGVQCYRLFSGFGATVAASGAAWEPFGWAGAAGDQTDADTGLVLMGHRLYDSRLGRFISQDPAGDGDNWYAYCDNDPVNSMDPTGLSQMWGDFGFRADDQMSRGSSLWDGYRIDTYEKTRTGTVVSTTSPDGSVSHSTVWGPYSDPVLVNTTYLGGGHTMFAGETSLDGNPQALQLTKELAAADDGTAGTLSHTPNPLNSVQKAIQAAKDWLGKEVKAIKNEHGDRIFMNKAGTKKLRFDINHPNPHESPHAHIEELVNGKWKGVGQIYPKDVPPR